MKDTQKTARKTIMGGRDSRAGKRPANLIINATLLDKARRPGINLLRALDAPLARLVREEETEEWLAANRKAIDAYNSRVECDGVWSDKLRGF